MCFGGGGGEEKWSGVKIVEEKKMYEICPEGTGTNRTMGIGTSWLEAYN